MKEIDIARGNGRSVTRREYASSCTRSCQVLELLGKHLGLFSGRHEDMLTMRRKVERIAAKYGLDPVAVMQMATELAEEDE